LRKKEEVDRKRMAALLDGDFGEDGQPENFEDYEVRQ
jgi:hypothetical protein